MKKITIGLLAVTFCLFLSNNTHAQAFQKGNKNFDLGIGFGAYGTTQTVTTTFNGVPIKNSDTDGAASMIVPIKFEYGVGEKVGIGAEFLYNNYVINDSDRVNLDKVSSIDFGVNCQYHLLNSDKNDLFIGLGLGMSSMSIKYVSNNNLIVESINGSGIYYSFGITDRIFFSENVGIFFNLGYRGYNYSSLEADFTSEVDALIANSGFTYSQTWEWKFSGVHIGTGLALKF